MTDYLFFDSASTTKCCEAAVQLIQKYSVEDFGNSSSHHIYGQKAARAIRDARVFFAQIFQVEPEQIVFTGSGTEANNLAIHGVATQKLARLLKSGSFSGSSDIQILSSSIEHPSVKRPIEALRDFGIQSEWIPVNSEGQIRVEQVLQQLTPQTALLSVHQVNNILGTQIDVETLAKISKQKFSGIIFHTDAVQSFGKVPVPQATSAVDLISISGHKIEGPKGIGALVILNKKLLSSGIRPLIWGGEQENGLRSGTQNAGLIAGFHIAAEIALKNRIKNFESVSKLKEGFKNLLIQKQLLNLDSNKSPITWNSPDDAVPHIINLGIIGYPAGPLSKLLEERGCLISVGSACSSQKPEPDPVLSAVGLPMAVQKSSIRISLSHHLNFSHLETLVHSLQESMQLMNRLMGKPRERKTPK